MAKLCASSESAALLVATKVALVAGDMTDIAGTVMRSVEKYVQRLKMPVALIQLHNRPAWLARPWPNSAAATL